MRKGLNILLLITSLSLINNSCSRDFINSEFNDSVIQSPLNSIEEIESMVRGGQVSMRSQYYYGCDFLMYGEARSNNMYADPVNGSGYYNTTINYTMTTSDGNATNTYAQIYQTIGKANLVINNTPSAVLTWKKSQDPVAISNRNKYLIGEAYAIRALAFFDLLRLYGQQYSGGTIGIVTPLKYNPLAKEPRQSIVQTQTQIESDFASAINNMLTSLDDYSDRTMINTNTVKALMSRYYLYKGDYATVRSLVSSIYSSGKYSVVSSNDYPKFFSTDNSAPNSIFELSVGTTNQLGTTSIAYKLNSGGYGTMRVLPALYTTYTSTDIRKGLISTVSGTYRLNGKYSDVTGKENIKVLRYEEILLNGAEAELNGGSTANALKYYNAIITNRGLTQATSVTLNDIYLERRKELVGEGFGYWDLLRLGQPIIQRDYQGTTVKTRNIGDNLLAFPIPRNELNVPGTPVVGNPGYAN